MKIKNRLSIQFTLISAFILLVVLCVIYVLAAEYRRNNFRERLTDRATIVAELFLAQDNLSTEDFKKVQEKYPQSLTNEVVQIYDENNQPVFIKQNNSLWTNDIIDKVKKNKSIYYKQGSKEAAGIYYVDNSGNFSVLISAVDSYGLKQLKQIFWVMVIAFCLSVLLIFYSGRWFAKMTLQPIVRIINEVKIVRSTNLNKRLEIKVGAKDEISELAITFNNLLEHLEQSFEAQSLFIAHASHELRTPFASIIGDIEVTLSHNRASEEYRKTLKQVLNQSEKLNSLLNNLFVLAQSNIDINSFNDIRLDELLWAVTDEWMNKIANSKIEVEYKLPSDTSKYVIQGNYHLLFIALGNIIKNAIKFSDNDTVYCKLYFKNSSPVISIRDSGIGIEKEDFKKIFMPFYRGSNTSGYSGSGIGLSLADKIFRLHNASITTASVLGKGTEFFITF